MNTRPGSSANNVPNPVAELWHRHVSEAIRRDVRHNSAIPIAVQRPK